MDSEDKMNSRKKEKTEQTSHKLIEKRRRDRINNCLAELSQAVPAAFAKQSTGKLEKAEILEMTVEYLRAIQATEIGSRFESGEWFTSDIWGDFVGHYQSGYSDCMRELIRYMTEVEHLDTADNRCVRILSYLQTRFRPDSSVNSGTVYRDSLSRSSVSPTQRQHVSSSNSQRSHHRFSPYSLPSGSHTPRTDGDLFGEKQVGSLAMITPVSSSSPLVSLVNLPRTSPAIRTQTHGLYGLMNGNFDRLIGVASNGQPALQSESRISAFTRQIQK
ncbi:hairy and enhancer of split-related protein helt-like [Lineus longissimus]|uniref:hairy and enhancer of split-related protein helt-like n=1 Tax=Lineus longissimus TaxID=88925 RepID=UPI002B4C4D99